MPLHVRDLGSGPPIVFLHPRPGLDGSVFLPHATQVAEAGFRVLLPRPKPTRSASHFPFAETPDRYWPALIDWLTRTRS
jgi:hypothetical protein